MATSSARKAAPAKKAPASKSKPKKAPEAAPTAVVDEAGVAWLPAKGGYALALIDGKVVARNEKGKRLASVPKDVGDSEVGEQLAELKLWLVQHDKACLEQVDTWMLRSLPVPRTVLESVWPDPSWRAALENAVVAPAVGESLDFDKVGFFKGVDASKGIGIVNLDGETAWLKAAHVAVPHPILLPELAALRELATELKLTQGVSQLFRETFPRAATVDAKANRVSDFENGKFAQLLHVLSKAKSLGFPVRGGYACCPVYEKGLRSEARFWIGADSPESETYTGDLMWVDAKEHALTLGDVGPVSWSEGVRMATAIYAARVVEKEVQS